MRGDETPGWIVTNFYTGVGVHDVITCADLYCITIAYGVHSFIHSFGLGVAGGQILAFAIDLLRRPYNTLALPYECVIRGIVTGWTGVAPLLPEVVPEIDANQVSFYGGGGGRSCVELDSPAGSVR